MKTMVLAAITAISSIAFCAEGTNNVVRIGKDKLDAIVAKNGGLVIKPGTGLGAIIYANEQRRVPIEELRSPVAYLEKYTKTNVLIKDVEPGQSRLTKDGLAKAGANMLILIKDDSASTSPLLVSPDEAWAIVNVAALATDNPKKEVLAFRLRKELSRAFAFLCGGVNTQYERTPVNFCKSLDDLDYIDMDEIPADLIARFRTYTPGYGVTPKVTATYKTACRHGWALPPTNDVQKAIWDEVHATPKNPMKIEFDPKKGR